MNTGPAVPGPPKGSRATKGGQLATLPTCAVIIDPLLLPTPAKPHGKPARLEINGRAYAVQPLGLLLPDGTFRHDGLRFSTDKGECHDVDLSRMSCDCADSTWRHRPEGCKHLRATRTLLYAEGYRWDEIEAEYGTCYGDVY